MAYASPTAGSALNSPSHSLLHRQFDIDTSASEQSMVIDAAGNVGIGTTDPLELLSLGTAGTTAGVLSLAGATSGKAIIDVSAVAGTPTLTLPTTTGTLALISDIPTLPVKAIGSELDTGSDDAKFATAKAIKDSHNVPSVVPSTDGNVLTSNGTDWVSEAAGGGGASQLSDLSDVVSAANTDKYALMANGTTGYVGRALVEADISDLGTYAATNQQFYIGTTQIAINRGSAALTLAGITLTTPDIGTPSDGTLTNCTFPTLNQNTTGTAANLSGTPNLGIGTLGCGAITSTGAITGNPVGILNLVSVNNAYGLNLTSYFANAAYSDYIYFKKSHSDTEAYVSTPTATIFGSIWAYGVGTDADKWDLSTSIRFEQDGAAGANYVPGKIVFKTGTNAAAPADALTLNSDKSVDLAGTARVAGDPATDGYFVIKLSGVSYKVPCLAV